MDMTRYSSGGKKLIFLKCYQRTTMIIEYCRDSRNPAEEGWDPHVKPGERWGAVKVAPRRILTSATAVSDTPLYSKKQHLLNLPFFGSAQAWLAGVGSNGAAAQFTSQVCVDGLFCSLINMHSFIQRDRS